MKMPRLLLPLRSSMPWLAAVVLSAAGIAAGCGTDSGSSSLTGSSGTGDETTAAGTGGAGPSSGGALVGGSFAGVGGTTGTGGPVCEETSAAAGDIQLDMIVVLDRSGSMGTKWDQSVTALQTFFSNASSDGVAVAMNFFPAEIDAADPDLPNAMGETCDVQWYNPPMVELGTLPNHYAVLNTAMLNEDDNGPNTPSYGALYGTYEYATQLQSDNADHKVIVVFVSDGQPNGCPDDQDDSATIAGLADAAYNFNSVETYVLALQGAQLTQLNALAAAGGTTAAIDITSNIQLFSDKMEEIRQQAIGCEYLIPDQGAGMDEFDATKVNVTYKDGNGNEIEVPKADNINDCGSTPGWYYDNPANPTKVFLCPASCSQVQNDAEAEVVLKFGCPTKNN